LKIENWKLKIYVRGMADINQNQNTAASDGDASKKKFDSPWDEELPPEEPKKANVVGSLDAKSSDSTLPGGDKKPVPFNIPTDVADEKVGKKIPAQTVIANSQQPNTKLAQAPIEKVQKPVTAPIQSQSVNTPKITPVIQPQAPKSIPISGTQNATSKPVGPSAGVNELIQPKKEPIAIPPKPIAMPKIAKPATEVKSAPPAIKVPINPAPVANIEAESGTLADIKPAEKITEKELPPPILPDISKPIDMEAEDELKPPAYITNMPKRENKTQDQKKPAPPEIKKPVTNNNPPFYKRAKFLIPAVAIFLFVVGVYLTEAGILGIGLEKVYGLVGAESLWGGLPRNPEKALGMSAQAMQKQLDFKIKGSISMTVNKTIKSPITSPLVSAINLPFALRDTNTIIGIKAITTQYDYYGDSTSNSATTDSSTSDSTADSSAGTDSSTSTAAPILGDQSSNSAYQPEESTIKQVDADIEGQSSDQAIKTDLAIKKLVGSGSTVSLLSTKNQLFVKSSQDIKFAGNAESSKWLEFNINNIQSENPFKDLASIKLDQGFSIIGRRSGNEKVGSIRCFKYSIDNLEIGDSLDFLGIKKDSVQKIEGNIWIGVADHYLHKIDLKIIPSISSSISQMSITLEMYDYGIENSIQIPALADKIIANITADSTATASAASTATATPSVAAAVTMGEQDQTRKSDLQNIKTALEKYKTANSKFPVANAMIHLDAKDNVVQKALVAEYITGIPADPKAADGWYYGYKSDGKTFTLSARLENTADKEVTKVGDIYLHWVYNN